MPLGNISINIGGTTRQENTLGVPSDVLTELVKQQANHTALQRREIERLAEALELKDGQVRAALKIVYEAEVPTELQGAKLIEIAERFKALLATSMSTPGDPAKVIGLKNRAQAAIEAGDLALADEVLAQIEAEHRQSLQRPIAAYAATSAQRGEIALARLWYREAAGHFANAAAVLPQTDEYCDARFNYLSQEADALYKHGDEFGDNASLLLAIERRQSLLQRCPRERVPLLWAGTQNNLGLALASLGGREIDTVRLEAAVAAYRAALQEYTRDRAPLLWAGTQSNLGVALWKLGERQSGTARLEEAVTTYRTALEEWRRDRVPLQWAGAQNNLGLALAVLGERQTGTARLEEAVAAYRAALKEFKRDRVPLDWARTQNHLGAALVMLGDREGGTTRLEEAVAAFRTALQECTRNRVPLQWAGVQNNLGNALARLGDREGSTARLEEAVVAFRSALEEWTRELHPRDWAGVQNNLGNALMALGVRESGTVQLEEAVAAYRAALEEWTRDRAPLQWAMTTGNQGLAAMTIADRTNDADLAEVAARQIERAHEMTHSGGHEQLSAYFLAQLPRAQAIRDRLNGQSGTRSSVNTDATAIGKTKKLFSALFGYLSK